MVPTPGYDQFGFSEEQAKEFVESQKIFHWDELARRRDRQSCCLSHDSSFVNGMSYSSMVAWHKSKWVLKSSQLTIQIQHS